MPESIIAWLQAGYLEVERRISGGRILEIGPGHGFGVETLLSQGPRLTIVDHTVDVAAYCKHRWGASGLHVACMALTQLAFADASFDWICSSHVIEHLDDPEKHVAEVGRVLKSSGTAFILAPNGPAETENPYHLTSFDAAELGELLRAYFGHVTILGLDGNERALENIEHRRLLGRRILSFDVLNLRHRIPRRWYQEIYSFGLRSVYALQSRRQPSGSSGLTAKDFLLTNEVRDRTLGLFALAAEPRRSLR